MKLHLPVLLRKALLACFAVCSAYTMGLVASAADLTLGNEDSLTIDYADIASIPDLENGTLQLNGDTLLLLSNCGVGDGQTYTLLTGVSALLDAEGNAIVLDSSNNAISNYFDTTLPGTDFWEDSTLVLDANGNLLLVRHNVTVKNAVMITTQREGSALYRYYAGIEFKDISSSSGGAIYGGENSTIRLSSNGSVTFIGNTASASNYDDASGGAIYGGENSTIRLSGNGSVTFSENRASSDYGAYGGAIYGEYNSTIALSGNGSVTFSGNRASYRGSAIYGYGNSTIALSGNGSVTFSGNTAHYGGAIYGSGTIELSGNGSVTFSDNTGGAILGYGNLNIRNNDSVLFEKNAEERNETYRLRSIYAGGSGDVISLSAAAGKSIEFRDSVYIASDNTVNLNADYTDANGMVHKQTGDIIFTGKYTEQHLNELLAADGLIRTATAEEILNSRTTEVRAMTNLYGGRLRVEDGAVYMGYGITAMEDSAATVLVKGGILNHAGYDLTFHVGTTLELAGENTLYGDVRMLEGSHFSVSIEKPNADYIFGHLQLGGDVSLSLSDSVMGENAILLYVSGGIAGWNEDNITLLSNTVGSDDLTWVGNMLVLNHNADTFNCYFNGEYSTSKQLIGNVGLVCYTGISFENISGGAIYGSSNSTIVLNGNGSVEFSGNRASSGGAIYGYDGSTIELSGNGSVTFSGNSASSSFDEAYGGAIYGYSNSTITLSGNGSVTFSGNTAYYGGGAIYGYGSTIRLSGNDSVTFSGNGASSSSHASYGGAIYGSTIELSGNGSVVFSENTASSSDRCAYGGAIYGYGDITLSGNDSVEFSGNSASSSFDDAYGGAIYGYGDITLSGNDSVEFSGNSASSSFDDAYGGAIYGRTIALSGNGSVEFIGNTASSSGGAIYGYDGSTIELSGNGSVEFIGNTASSSGGAIYGVSSTIELSGNGSVTFSGNTAYSSYAYGGAIYGYGSTIELSENGSVTFIGNTASSFGGAIYGNNNSTITLSDNESVTFSGNTADDDGGAIYGNNNSTIELSGNGSVTFSGNTAYYYGGAIYGSGNLSIRNNDSVLFEKNAEVEYGTYRLRSIYAGGSGGVISLSAAAGKSIEFRDSVYIASDSTVNLNADYTDANGVVHKQTGDIIFTGAYTEQHLNELLAADGVERMATAEEILNSRTTKVYAMTNLYGGRLRVEDGAVYKGYGITAMEDSAATVLVKDGTLNHAGYDLTFHVGTTLELAGNNSISGNVMMQKNSTLLLNAAETFGVTDIVGKLNIAGGVTLALSDDAAWRCENGVLLYVYGDYSGWEDAALTVTGVGTYGQADVSWVDNLLVLNYNAETFNCYFNGSAKNKQNALGLYHHYNEISFENLSSSRGGAIYTVASSPILLFSNDSVTFSGNTASSSGGAIYGGSNSTIELSGNGSVEFSGNTASSGGAICGSTITLSGNGSVTFSGSSSAAYGGAIYGYSNSRITLSGNGSVEFSGNSASFSGGAIYGEYNSTIELSGNGSVEFSGNRASGGAILGYGNLNIRNNDSVLFEKNAEERNETYRLRSIYAGGSGDVISLSAAAGKSIEFRDSVYIASDNTVNLNADYTDANGVVHKQTGDIIFTGKYTEQHLNELLAADGAGRTATAEEILNSRTTEVRAMTNLYGGRLRVEDGAVYMGYGITAMEDSAATVLVKEGTLNHAGYDLTFLAGTTLELAGKSVISGNLNMLQGSLLEISVQEGQYMTHSGSLSVEGDVRVLVQRDGLPRMNGVKELLILHSDNADNHWNPTSLSITSCCEISDGYVFQAGESYRKDNALYLEYALTDTVTWSNAAGDVAWNNQSANWNYEGYSLADIQGINHVVLSTSAQGTIELAGQIAVGSLRVDEACSYVLNFAENATLQLTAGLVTEAGSELTLHGDLRASLVSAAGKLVVDGLLSVVGDVSGTVVQAETLTVGGHLSGAAVSVGGNLSAASLDVDSLKANTLNLTDAAASNMVNGDVFVRDSVDVAGNLTVGGHLSGELVSVGGSLESASLTADSLSAASLRLTDAAASNTVKEVVSVSGAVEIAGSLSAGGSLSGTAVTVGGVLSAASLTADNLHAASLRLTDAGASNRVKEVVSVSGAVDVAGSLSAAGLHLTDEQATHSIGGAVTIDGAVEIAGSLSTGGSLSGTAVTVGGALSATSLTADSLQAASLRLTDTGASNAVKEAVSVSGAVDVAGSLSAAGLLLTDEQATHSIGGAVTIGGSVAVAGSLSAGGSLSGTAVTAGGALSAASLTADSLSAASLRLTDTGASNTVKEAVSVSGAVDVAGSLSTGGSLSGTAVTVGGSISAASLTADSLSAASLELTAAGAANSVSGDLTADAVSLASGASLKVGGTLTAAEVLIHDPAKVLQVGAFGAETMNFVLDRAALESLNLSYEETGTIARANTAMGNGFTATLNGGTKPVQAAAYVYDISVNGGAVQLTADYAHDGLQVWYRSGWVGQSDWTDFYIAGYDAVNGVETVDLGGDTVQGAALFIAYEDDVRSSVVKNGELEFEYVDMGGGQFELGENATMTTDELYGKGETLVMHRDSVLNATELTLGTLALEGGELTVKKATINAMSGTEGTLNIERNGRVTVKSDVTLTGLKNLGNLNLGKNTLTVNALVDEGGDVTAGEVAVQSRGSRMASFDKLVADKVTVVNNISTGRYTDDLSVGDGSSIGELVAEMLEVREGVVTLGRTDAATEQVLKALDLQDDAALVLNQRTALTVTDELSATEGSELRLKQQASVSYGDMNISNRGAAAQVVVNAYDLANDSIQELSHAHVAVSGDEDRSIDYKLTNSSVENTGSGKLYLTHAENTFSSISADTGDIAVMNQALALNLDELVVGEGVSFSAYRGEVELPEQEAVVSVSQSVSFGAGAHINADLKLQSGVRVEMNGPVSMGSDLYLFSGMTLGGSMLESIQRAEQGQTVVLFSGIDTLYLSGEEQTDAIALSHGVSASEYFVNLISSQERSYYLVYDNELPGEGVLSIAVSGLAVPEPTSSTLSLLALAALAARRRRK